MTATTLDYAPGAVTWELRIQVWDRVEQEYLRLRAVDRPALLKRFDADDDGTDIGKVGRAIAITDYQIAAIGDYLRTVHEPHPDSSVCPDCCVLLDRGEGPRWHLLAALSDGDDPPVIASDSALGRAVIGARAGQVVHYPTPTGQRMARVIALEPGYLD